jgi:hypothetical protein
MKPSDSAKSTRGADECSPSTGPASPSTTISGHSQATLFESGSQKASIGHFPTPRAIYGEHPGMTDPSHLTGAVLISSPGGIPASHSLSPGSDWARRMTAISGRQLLHWLPTSGPLAACSRTLAATSRWGSTRCYLTWNRSATPAGRSLFRLRPSAPPTGGIASGFWPTPNVAGGGNQCELTPHKGHYLRPSGEKAHLGLDQAVRMWPTPKANDAKNASLPPSHEQWDSLPGRVLRERNAKMIPTPTANDAHNAHMHPSQKNRNSIIGMLIRDKEDPVMWPTPNASDNRDRGNMSNPAIQRRVAIGKQVMLSMMVNQPGKEKLSPAWVGRLMGYPDGWLDLDD